MSPASAPSDIARFVEERRAFPRQVIDEDAELLISELSMRLPCVVVNISAAGAKITCDAIPPSGSPVMLFFKGGLSIEAVTTRYGQGELNLRFTTPGEK